MRFERVPAGAGVCTDQKTGAIGAPVCQTATLRKNFKQLGIAAPGVRGRYSGSLRHQVFGWTR